MNASLLAFSDQVTVALGVLVLVAAILITSILRYQADDFVKFWVAVGTVLGVALGGVGTFFFTKEQVEHKDSELKITQHALKMSETEKANVAQRLAHYTTVKDWSKIVPTTTMPDPSTWVTDWNAPSPVPTTYTSPDQWQTTASSSPSLSLESPAPPAAVSPHN